MKQYLAIFECTYDKTHIGHGASAQAIAICAWDMQEAEHTAIDAAKVMDKASGPGTNWRIKEITKIGVNLQ